MKHLISTESYLLALLLELYEDANLRKIIVCKDEAQAQKLQKEVLSLGNKFLNSDDVLFLPGYLQTGIFKYESSKKIIAARLHLAHTLSKHTPRLVIASVGGFARAFPRVSWVKTFTLGLTVGKNYDPDVLISNLSHRLYTEVKQVEEVGEYAVRGSIVDVWTPGQATPTRLEFSDDTLEKIKSFRAYDQKSFASLQHVDLLPAREFVWPESEDLQARVDQFNEHILKQKIVGINRSNLLEDLKSSVPFPGIDDLAYMFSQPLGSFLSDLSTRVSELSSHGLTTGSNPIEVCVDCFASHHEIEKAMSDIETVYNSAQISSTNNNVLVGNLKQLFPGIRELEKILKDDKQNSEAEKYSFTLPQKTSFQDKIENIKALLRNSTVHKIYFAVKTQDSALEILGLLTKYFKDLDVENEDLKIPEFDFRDLVSALDPAVTPPDDTSILKLQDDSNVHYDALRFVQLDIDGCFFIPSSKTLFISENLLRGRATREQFEDFSKIDPKAQSAQNTQVFFSSQFSDFSEGDIVVHVQHGICRFRGLATIKILDVAGEFLALEFAGNDKIYVPVNKLNLVQKYIGSSSTATLDSLKSNAWTKRKERVKKDVEQIAAKLLEHHAKQASTPGTAFSKIGEEYIAFEDAFPFDETPDQLKATHEIMADMGQPKAMDRLLCGDVGFGKTEVAMRACYRCVLDGKQVAWLVPTTVLAHQHLRTLKERFASFGVNVQMLDRSTSNSNKTLEQLKNGAVDILIGTHRILAKDIQFRDLGLLVVDEEQHFGVMQKEKIKSMSYGIDVLTLTATPIPRTLQMALMGIRELSLLTTPPKSRLATKTFVCPFEDKTIIDAISFELSRGGQIFYVHNRVEELKSIQTYLSNLMPHLRIAVGHGKMSQTELETTMVEFLDGKFNLLLCTTIVEAGIDMPNVNTIIVQNADFFGLSQLYQLRGRVGRRATRGYAYFVVDAEKFSQNTDGMKRLEILKDHQELGSGFLIASQDLEMRGAGEILGDEQSGKVAEIGLETYLQMLDDAIKKLGGVRVEQKTEVEIQVPLATQIPEDYIESARERLIMYRRFFGARDEHALMNLAQECVDRFGELPEEVHDLVELSRFRRLLLTVGAISLTVGEDGTECRLDQKILQGTDDFAEAFVKRVLDLCNRQSRNMRITQDGRLLFPLKRKQFIQNKKSSVQELKRILSLLAGV